MSVVITTRNRLAWLKEALRSVDAQRGVTCEIIVVDDASTDGTWEHLRAVGSATLRVEHNETALERTASRNHGLALARGDVVMFLDDDDWLWDGALATLVSALDAEPRAVAAVGARWDWFVAEGHQRRDAHPYRPITRWITDDLMFGWSAVSGQNLFRTDTVRAVGGYHDCIPGEDRDLWFRVARLGPVVLRPEIVMTYRIHDAQQRPPDIRALRERIARTAIRELPVAARRRALRIRRATSFFDESQAALARGALVHGCACAVRAMAAAPELFTSPLVGPLFVRRLAGRLWHRLRGD